MILGVVAVSLSACSVMPEGLFGKRNKPEQVLSVEPETVEEGAIPEDARTVEEFDTTSASDRAAALEAANATGGERSLGTTVASLGDVTEAGIWLKTPLVSEPGKGRVEFPGAGTAVAVDLIPLEGSPGAGSRISLAAMRLLEADLTSLPELRVFLIN
jgi:hypothetical protein